MSAASTALAALNQGGVGVSPSDLADLLGVASNVLRERGRLASAAGTGPQAVAEAAAEAAALAVRSFFFFFFLGGSRSRGALKKKKKTHSSPFSPRLVFPFFSSSSKQKNTKQ